jgi:hypothetical protein
LIIHKNPNRERVIRFIWNLISIISSFRSLEVTPTNEISLSLNPSPRGERLGNELFNFPLSPGRGGSEGVR